MLVRYQRNPLTLNLHAADNAHQTIFNVGDLRRLQGALSVDHDQGMLIGGEGPLIVIASEDSIREALS
jgi:hypothetical protein